MTTIATLIWILLFALTIITTEKYNRSLLVWCFVAFVFSPLLSLICLWIIGRK